MSKSKDNFIWSRIRIIQGKLSLNTLDYSIKQEPTLARFKNKMESGQVTSARAEYASNIYIY